jgi:hypothetical protein
MPTADHSAGSAHLGDNRISTATAVGIGLVSIASFMGGAYLFNEGQQVIRNLFTAMQLENLTGG